MAPSKAKKKEKPQKVEKENHVWLYGTPKISNGSYEFHKNLQEHIEAAYQKGQKNCKVSVYGKVWKLNFQSMTESRKLCKRENEIKRVPISKLKKNHVVGVAGTLYERNDGFQQTDTTCSICFYPLSIPTRIEDCGHVFCFVCLKSNFKMGLDCPTCRGEIPSDLFHEAVRSDLDIHMECPEEYVKDLPGLFRTTEAGKHNAFTKPTELRRSERVTRTKHYWLYESPDHNGWFRYDPKNERYLEECYVRGKKQCHIFVCGFKMVIDFKYMNQDRSDYGDVHKRHIKRINAQELNKHDVKGIAGVRCHAHPIVG